MHVSSNTICKKISAGLILALFFFIQAEKVFHKHLPETVSTQQTAITLQSISASCVICDFQVAKDSELPVLTSITLASIGSLKKYLDSPAPYYYLPSAQISNRGPPAI